MQQLLVLLAAVAVVNAQSSCIDTPLIVSEISQARIYAPDILSVGFDISTAELSSPSLYEDEYIIESYAYSDISLVRELETYFFSPANVPPSQLSQFTELTLAHSTLSSALSSIVSFEELHPSFATAQRTIESVEQTQSSILTYLIEYIDYFYPSISWASDVIDQATLESPDIVGTVVSVYTADVSYPSVIYALSYLSASVYTLPSTVVDELLTIVTSPSTAAPSVISSLESCYPSVYTEIGYITEFTDTHPRVVSAISYLLSVASSVSSLSTAVSTIISQQMPTLTYQITVVTSISYTWPSFIIDMEYISDCTATSPTLGEALSTIESNFYYSPSVATDIYYAISSPSTVTDPSQVSQDEISHSSLVSAITEVISWENNHPKKKEKVKKIIHHLIEHFKTHRTLLTAISYISSVQSPSMADDQYVISTLETVIPDITTVLAAITSITSVSPTISCDESEVAWYAVEYPTYIEDLWTAVDSPSVILPSEVSYYASLEGSYPTAFSALLSIADESYYYPSIDWYEGSFLYAISYAPDCLSDYGGYDSGSSSCSGWMMDTEYAWWSTFASMMGGYGCFYS